MKATCLPVQEPAVAAYRKLTAGEILDALKDVPRDSLVRSADGGGFLEVRTDNDPTEVDVVKLKDETILITHWI